MQLPENQKIYEGQRLRLCGQTRSFRKWKDRNALQLKPKPHLREQFRRSEERRRKIEEGKQKKITELLL